VYATDAIALANVYGVEKFGSEAVIAGNILIVSAEPASAQARM